MLFPRNGRKHIWNTSNQTSCTSTASTLNPDKPQLVVQRTVGLHNFLLTDSSGVYAPPGTVDQDDQNGNVTNG